jgi:DNA mismatch repair protein MutS
VARLAGLPEAALARADEVLRALEQGEKADQLSRLADDLPLFAAAERPKSGARGSARRSAVEETLKDVHPDGLTPKDALDLVYRLKALLPKDGS